MTDSDLNEKKIRRTVLLLPVALAFVAATIPLCNESYNFSGVYSCSIAPYPLGCGTTSGVPCIRGGYARMTVGWITFLFNAIAYICAFLGYYTEGVKTGTGHNIIDSWPVVMLNFIFCLSFLIGTVFILTYGSISAKLFTFYLSVILTPLTGFFMAIIYYYSSSSKPPHLDEDDNVSLSEPFIMTPNERTKGWDAFV